MQSMTDFFSIADVFAKHQSELITSIQTLDAFSLGVHKQLRLREAAKAVVGGKCEKIYIIDDGINLGNLSDEVGGRSVFRRSVDWYSRRAEGNAASQDDAEFMRGVVIFTNNDLVKLGFQTFLQLRDAFPHNIYVVWDFDNHHWLECSLKAALLSDVYVPSHFDNLFLLSRFNPFMTEPINCGVVQWTYAFLLRHLSQMIDMPRSDEPLGRHTPYARFAYRQQVLLTLSQNLPFVGPCDTKFHSLTAEEKLNKWCEHKTHFIVPALNDLPIRAFDALITGGIPLIPRPLMGLAHLAGIGDDEAVYYDSIDIAEPRNLVNAANRFFDRAGERGMLTRIEKALRLHHLDARIAKIADAAEAMVLDAN